MSPKHCVHYWRVPSPGSGESMSTCRRCRARRRFPQNLTRNWSPIRPTRQQVQEFREELEAAEAQL